MSDAEHMRRWALPRNTGANIEPDLLEAGSTYFGCVWDHAPVMLVNVSRVIGLLVQRGSASAATLLKAKNCEEADQRPCSASLRSHMCAIVFSMPFYFASRLSSLNPSSPIFCILQNMHFDRI